MADKANNQLNISAAAGCNLHCVYCKSPVDAAKMPPLADICAQVRAQRIKTVCLGCSGEATANPDFLKWLGTLRNAGVERFTLSTNAVALSDAKLCREAARAIDFFAVNLPSHRPEIYAAITGADKFADAFCALKNLKKYGALGKLSIAHIVSGCNLGALPDFADWAAKNFKGLLFVNLVFVHNAGRVRDNAAIVPKYSEAAVFIKLALAKLKLGGIKGVVQHFPLCHLNGYEAFSLEFQRRRDGQPPVEQDMPPRARCAACKKCTLAASCYGAREDYKRIHGLRELKASSLDPASVPELLY
jgi:MoaA/NifB/PqqE/SkfB family radical SAM enzyme